MLNKRFFLLILAIFVLLANSCSWQDPKGSIVVMSLNARYDNPADAPNDWSHRTPIIFETVLDKSADIIGFQELLKHQLDDLDSILPWYDYVGVGRDDGRDRGEFSPIFYKMNRFVVVDDGTFWLSENPEDTGSVSWDAALPRIATWVKFRDMHLKRKDNNVEFYFLNTHFDHMGDTARMESARLIRKFIELKTEGLQVVVTGDFNFSSSESPYRILTENGLLMDACTLLKDDDQDCEPTFNGFGKSSENRRIDFIFLDPRWHIFSYEMLQVKKDDIFISDHYPIIARIKVGDL